MRSNKDLTNKEFLVAQKIKRAMLINESEIVADVLKEALVIMYR